MKNWNPSGDYPNVEDTSYIHPTAVIIGKVRVGKKVFIGPGAIIRADEPGSSIVVQDNCNVQDRVIIHALEDGTVEIEENTSLAHGCIVHGPCKIGKGCFIGFGSVVFKSELGENVFIKHLSVVEGVNIPSKKVVEFGQSINAGWQVQGLKSTDDELENFSKNVVKANLSLVKGYKQ